MKPPRSMELKNALAAALGERSQPAPAALPAAAAAAGPPARKLTVLVAEDNPINQQVARRLIERRGHTVVLAVNGQEAVELSERQAFDLILMDLQMPGMDGLEATAAIREREGYRSQRQTIYALTAHAMPGDEQRCHARGMDGYLSKPLKPADLYAALRAVEQMAGEAACPMDTLVR